MTGSDSGLPTSVAALLLTSVMAHVLNLVGSADEINAAPEAPFKNHNHLSQLIHKFY
jgi:hypothetical protein